MSDRHAFLEAIAAAPDDDLPRLVFADRLDDHGDSRRAEFIRAQCELARLPEADPRRAELRRLSGELFSPIWPPAGLGVRGWRRGFPWRWRWTDADLLAAFQAEDCGPMFETSLDLNGRGGYLPRSPGWADRLAAHPRMDSVTRIVYTNWPRPEPHEFLALIDSPHLKNLRCVEVDHVRIGPAGVRALCEPSRGSGSRG